MKGKQIGRRSALKYFGFLSSSAAGWEFLANWLPHGSDALASPGPAGLVPLTGGSQVSAPAGPVEPYSLHFFKSDEFRTVQILTEMIIPTDDQPGAKEARVAEYIDFVLFSASEFEPSLQKHWIDGLEELERQSNEKFGNSFLRVSASEREELLKDMSLPERDPKAEQPGFPFYRTLKEMTVDAFYSSRVGLIDVLGYKGLAFLTEFPGCTSPPGKT
ncbi:MAG: gluconate 2-dehydrogenase subunit 3 family protein [Acidobacteriota bacterium]